MKLAQVLEHLSPSTIKTLSLNHINYCITQGFKPTLKRLQLHKQARDFACTVAYRNLLQAMGKVRANEFSRQITLEIHSPHIIKLTEAMALPD